jgi:uncharacterized protein (DUF58 family)
VLSLRPAGTLLAMLVGLMGILGNWSPNPLLATLWSLPAAMLLVGLAYESWLMSRAQLSLHIVTPDRWHLGRPGDACFEFQHALGRAVALEVAPGAPPDFSQDGTILTVPVPPAHTVSVPVRLVPRRLGVHSWPPLKVRVGGALGLAWWPRSLHEDCTLRVAPDLVSETSGVAGVGSVGVRGGRRIGSGSELLQLRPYQTGDSPRVIDWKATARTRRLTSRDFSEDQHLEIVLLIDAGRSSGLRAGELDRFGHYANVAARLAQYAVSLDDQVGLVIFADRPLLELAPARGAAAVMRIRQALTAARVEGAESNPLHAAVRVRSLVRHRCLVVMLTDMDDTTVAGQLAGAIRLLRPKHLPFVAGLSSAAAETLARAPAHGWLDPYKALAAQEYCVGLERKVRALRALGAPALVAKPDQLERAVFDAYATFRRLRRV